mgnify:CR=1 FL=1
MKESTSNPILTSTAAQILRISEGTVRLWERTGRLHAVKTSGGVRLFDRAEVTALAEQLDDTRRGTGTARGRSSGDRGHDRR